MSDRLENYIRDHREEFDLNEPASQIWKGIEKNIHKKKTIRFRYYMSRAAVVLIIAGLTLLAHDLFLNKKIFTAGQDKKVKKEIVIPELKEAEVYYSGMVNEKLRELKPELEKNPTIEKELNSDLSDLDSVYQSLKKDLNDDVANQEVIEAMIQNYRLRVSILEDMLEYLNKKDSSENSNLPKHDI